MTASKASGSYFETAFSFMVSLLMPMLMEYEGEGMKFLKRWLKLEDVHDEDVPELRHHINQGVRWFVMLGFPVNLIMAVGLLMSYEVHFERFFWFSAILFVGALGWMTILLLRPPHDVTWGHTAYMSYLFFYISHDSYWSISGQSSFENGVYITYTIMVLLCPLHWTRLSVLGMSMILSRCLAIWVTGVRPDVPMDPIAGIALVGVCILGSTMIRSLWKSKRDAQQQALAADRLTTMGIHTAGIAHELKTPLASACNGLYSLHNLEQELYDSLGHPEVTLEDLREICKEIRDNNQRVESCVHRAIQFVAALRTHMQEMHHHEKKMFSPHARLEDVKTFLAPMAQKYNVELLFDLCDHNVNLLGDPEKFDQILINLITNAMEACAPIEREDLYVLVGSMMQKGCLILSVKDNGPGVAQELQSEIFKSLFTTKGNMGGTGLGLALCRDITQGVFGGTLELVPSKQGARFDICLPLQNFEQNSLMPKDENEFIPFAPKSRFC